MLRLLQDFRTHIHIEVEIHIHNLSYLYLYRNICNNVTDSEKPLQRKGLGCYAVVTACYRIAETVKNQRFIA
jgi:anaerobic ribonucleoside-triphosphate reductase